jgi:hypothetical protein
MAPRFGGIVRGFRWVSQGSSSFLKKRTKKLLNPGPSLSGEAEANVQKFFGSFFSKKNCFLPKNVTPA